MANFSADYQRPVKAKLQVALDTGEVWDATPADLEQFGLVETLQAYYRVDDVLTRVLTEAGLIEGDLTEARLNPVRYLVELAIRMPKLLDHPENRGWKEVVAIERLLQLNAEQAVESHLRGVDDD
jgi:hypothetical protein